VTYDCVDTGGRMTSRNSSRTHSKRFPEPEGRLAWVDSHWFVLLSAVLILANLLVALMAKKFPESERTCQRVEDGILVFFVLEMCCRLLYNRADFFCGASTEVVSNVIDLLVVACSVFDQWVLPYNGSERSGTMLASVLRCIRILWVFRMLRQMYAGSSELNLSFINGVRFEAFIACVIVFNAVVMGFETDIEWCGWLWMQQLMLLIFVFELVVRINTCGMVGYFCRGDTKVKDLMWNWLDATIVATGAVDLWIFPAVSVLGDEVGFVLLQKLLQHMSFFFRMLRLLRILRLLKLVKAVLPLYRLAMGMLRAFQGVIWVFALTLVVLYAYSILMTHLIGHGLLGTVGDESPRGIDAQVLFRDVPASMFQLFKIMNGDLSDLESIMMQSRLMRILIGVFLITAHWGLLAVLTAVVSDNIITVTQEQVAEEAEANEATVVENLTRLLSRVDADGNDEISKEELVAWLKCPQHSEELKEVCQLSPSDVVDVWEIMNMGGCVQLTDLVQALRIAKRTVSEKSMFRVEARFVHLANVVEDYQEEANKRMQELREAMLEQTTLLQAMLPRTDDEDGRSGSNASDMQSPCVKVQRVYTAPTAGRSTLADAERRQGLKDLKLAEKRSSSSFFWTQGKTRLLAESHAAAEAGAAEGGPQAASQLGGESRTASPTSPTSPQPGEKRRPPLNVADLKMQLERLHVDLRSPELESAGREGTEGTDTDTQRLGSELSLTDESPDKTFAAQTKEGAKQMRRGGDLP